MDFSDPYVIIGICGMVLMIFGLWRTTSGVWRHTSAWYELDTIIGASLLITYQLHVKAYVSLPINVFLVFVCFRGLSSYAERYAYKKTRHITRRWHHLGRRKH